MQAQVAHGYIRVHKVVRVKYKYTTLRYDHIQVTYEYTRLKYYLRNRKHVPCFYRVTETRVEVWENEKCCGNTNRRRVFPELFRVLPNFITSAIITSAARASSVTPSIYRNPICNQSARLFSRDCFLDTDTCA